ISTGIATADQAEAVGDHYYNGMTEPSNNQAYQKASYISNQALDDKHYGYADKTKYKAVGRVSNKNGWKGLGKDSMGTGFMVDNHTFITNAHVIEDKNGNVSKAKHISFDMNRDGNKKPYTFHATNVTTVPSYDIAIVHTKENMAQEANATPLKLASDGQINNLRYNQNLYSLGYGFHPNTNTKAHWSQFKYLQKSSNQAEIMTKDRFRAGDSGSPMVDGNYNVYGLRTYGYNLRNDGNSIYANQEVSGGES